MPSRVPDDPRGGCVLGESRARGGGDGPELVMPHLHSSVLDDEFGRTDPAKVANLVRTAKRYLGVG